VTARRIRLPAVLAASLLFLASCGSGGGGGGSGSGYQPPKGPVTETIQIDAQNFFFTPKNATAKAGIAKLELLGKGGIHTLVFDHAYSGFEVEVSGSGDSQSLNIDLKPGTYTFYCSIAGHRAMGMEGTLTVTK
jgi:plastocyanin